MIKEKSFPTNQVAQVPSHQDRETESRILAKALKDQEPLDRILKGVDTDSIRQTLTTQMG